MKCAFCERCWGGAGQMIEEASRRAGRNRGLPPLVVRVKSALALALALAACEGGFQVKVPGSPGVWAPATAVSPRIGRCTSTACASSSPA